MAMIFPGMDPYLENPLIWHGVHAALAVYIRDQLRPLLYPRYIAAVDDRVYLEGPNREVIPDVWLRQTSADHNHPGVALAEPDAPVEVQEPDLEIHEPYVTILDRQSGQQVVTVIEIVSPANKYSGDGRRLYLNKQAEVRSSEAHLVEIDLLRTGPHVLAVREWTARGQGAYHYLISVNRARGARSLFELYPSYLQQRLPRIRVPLAGDDPDVPLDLQAVVTQVYEAGSYRDRLNYDAPCLPPLSQEDQAWANQRIQEARQGS